MQKFFRNSPGCLTGEAFFDMDVSMPVPIATSCANAGSQCRSSPLFDRCDAHFPNFCFPVWRQMFLEALLLVGPF